MESPPARPLLAPFRGWRYDPAQVDVTAALCPPYDVVDPADLAALQRAEPHNAVRLTVPRAAADDPGRHERAARTLHDWQRQGVLRQDDHPSFYVVEQHRDGRVLQRGLLGALALHDPADRVVLPHEDVMPGPVADRGALLAATQANVEPILTFVDAGAGAAVDAVAHACRQPPLMTATTADGLTHVLWALDDADTVAAVAADLDRHVLLIADGHHRDAAARGYQRERRSGAGPGPWDRGLALVVDLRVHPPELGAIHRSVAGLALDAALAAAQPDFSAEPAEVGRLTDPAGPEVPGDALLLVQGDRAVLLRVADHAAVAADLPADRPEEWRRLQTTVLHEALLRARWQVDEGAVGYHHDPSDALAAAEAAAGLAVLLPPVPVEVVLELAAQGIRMPRKTTSFGPKPRTGLVFRVLEDG